MDGTTHRYRVHPVMISRDHAKPTSVKVYQIKPMRMTVAAWIQCLSVFSVVSNISP